MKEIHEIIIESVSGNFWKFCGYWSMIALFLGVPAKVIIFAINIPLRHYTLRKIGYPPAHCDANGDIIKES